MMMTMDQPTAGFGDFGGAYASDPFAASQSSSPPIGSDPDVDWSVFENAERYLLRDDSAWITRLSKDFWWNLDRISEMISYEIPSAQAMNNRPGQGKYNQQQPQQQQQQQQHFMQQSAPPAAKPFMQQAPPPMQFGGAPPRKIVGQRSGNNGYRNGSMFNNGFASPPPSSSSSSSSSGSTIVRPPANNHGMVGGGGHNNNNNNFNIPDKSNFFQAFSSMSIAGGPNDQDIEYNPFQSKIFDNNMWGASAQQPIPWQ